MNHGEGARIPRPDRTSSRSSSNRSWKNIARTFWSSIQHWPTWAASQQQADDSEGRSMLTHDLIDTQAAATAPLLADEHRVPTAGIRYKPFEERRADEGNTIQIVVVSIPRKRVAAVRAAALGRKAARQRVKSSDDQD
jgi:hypothetical protein